MTDILLPCPFCGGEAKIHDIEEQHYWCECKKCGVATNGERAKDNAIASWNTRTPPTGEWKNGADDEYPHCTICGYMPMFDPHIDDIYYSPYCPNCGAKMKEES